MFDLHTHHDRCGHATGSLEEYVESAIERGLDTLGFSDHSPFFGEDEDHPKPWVAMAKSQFPEYFAEAVRLRDRYRKRIDIRIGVESDFIPAVHDRYRAAYRPYRFDYIIGSVHILHGVDVFKPDRWSSASESELVRAKRDYCDLVAQAAMTGDFDIIGHVDVIKANCPEMDSLETPATDRMLRSIAESDTVLEVNTSGSTKRCGGWYPSPELLERAHSLGVKVTFGSDAHVPDRVGDSFKAVAERLRAIGFTEWYTFRDRTRIARKL